MSGARQFICIIGSVALCIILCISCSKNSPSEPADGTTGWERTFGTDNVEEGYSVEETSDGGFIIAGYGTISADIFLIKTDNEGTEEWSTTIGGSSYDYGRSVQQTADGGYIIAGYTYSFGAGDYDAYLVKTDNEGSVTWTKTFGGSDRDYVYAIDQTADGGYILAGESYSFGGNNRVYVIRTNGVGDTLWTGIYGDAAGGRGIVQTATGFIIVGYTFSQGAGNQDLYLVKIDPNGNFVWSRTFGGADADAGFSVSEASDGGFLLAGNTLSFGSGGYDVYLVKTDAQGDSLWTQTFGGANQDHGMAVRETPDGGIILAGFSESYGAGGYDFYLIKATEEGTMSWYETVGGSADDAAYAGAQTTDGGYILVGTTESYGAGWKDVYLVKVISNPESN